MNRYLYGPGKRSRSLHVNVTAQDHARIIAAACAERRTISDWCYLQIRLALEAADPPEPPEGASESLPST